MDTFENNPLTPENEPEQPVIPEEEFPAVEEPQPDPIPRKKESPYADSPYVMQQPVQPRYQPVPAEKKAKAKKKPGKGRKILSVLLILALVVGSCAVTAGYVNNYWEGRHQQTENLLNQKIDALQAQIDSLNRHAGNSISGSPAAIGEGFTPAQVYAQNVDSVVAISASVSSSIYGQVTEGASSGSGFILSEDGYVVTNYHVVEGASSVSVIAHDGNEYEATVVGYDATNDVAVLKVEASGLPAVTLGSSQDLIIGDMVVAIGNPLGELNSTQTVGYVSGIGREVSTDSLTTISMIQTDAAINPGNSGGPLFNMKGEVVGITTAKYSGTTASGASIEGIGFAIPIDDVVLMIDDLIDYGFVTGAYLGVTVQNVDEASAAMFNLPSGAYVLTVTEGVSAHRAGVQPKDIIIDLGGYKVTNVTTLTRALRNFKAGDTTTITVVRGGAEKVLTITLDEKPQNLDTIITEEEIPMPSEGSFEDWYDFFDRYFGN